MTAIAIRRFLVGTFLLTVPPSWAPGIVPITSAIA